MRVVCPNPRWKTRHAAGRDGKEYVATIRIVISEHDGPQMALGEALDLLADTLYESLVRHVSAK